MRGIRLIVALVILIARGTPVFSQITVACAANMQYAMEEIRASYVKSGGDVKVIYGASGKFVMQVRSGAPFDVFVSADMDYPESLFVWKLAIDKPKIYAFGKLVVWSMKPGLAEKGMAALSESGVKAIAIADPKRAPYGREAVHAMRTAGIYDAVSSRLVFGESISQAAQYILTGTADIGICAISIVVSDRMKGKGAWVEVDSTLYNPIAQGVVVCRYGADNNPAVSGKFVSFLCGNQSRTILKKYGYSLP